MLAPEMAAAELAKWRLPNDTLRIESGLRELGEPLRAIALELFDSEHVYTHVDYQERMKRRYKAAAQLDALPPKQRRELFDLISPHLAPALEQAWQLHKTGPYQVGYARKAFRAPQQPQLALTRSADWLVEMVELCQRFDPAQLTPTWLAAWAPHLNEGYHNYTSQIGVLMAAVLHDRSKAADDVFEILRQSLTNQHDVGGMGRHVITGFLLSDRAEGWELIEKTLLAAQRQEGLRQAILEAVDETHPTAFRRMLRLILEHDLIRFSAVVRAVDVWFGHLWAAASAGTIKNMLDQVVNFLDDSAARDKALRGQDAETAFLALWSLATEDALASVPQAERLLASKSVEMRYAAVTHLGLVALPQAADAAAVAIGDEDLRVAVKAVAVSYRGPDEDDETNGQPETADSGAFERIEQLLDRLPVKPQKLKPLVWPWTEIDVKASKIAMALIGTLRQRSPARLIPHLPKLDPPHRSYATRVIIDARPWDAATRQTVMRLAGDASPLVRDVALEGLLQVPPTGPELEILARYLTRKTGDLRRKLLDLFLKQPDATAVNVASGLLAAKDAQQRLAGLELLRLLADQRRAVDVCRKLAADYQAARKAISREEQSHLTEIMQDKVAAVTLDDALGLMNPAERTPTTAPRNLKTPFLTKAAAACLKSLDELVHEHRETPIQVRQFDGTTEELLGNVNWGFPSPDHDKPRDGQQNELPLAEIWLGWLAKRGKPLRDKDGLELVRADLWIPLCDDWQSGEWKEWAKKSDAHRQLANTFSGGTPLFELRYPRVVSQVIDWLLFLDPQQPQDYLLDALETAYALVPPADQQLLTQLNPVVQRSVYVGDDEDQDWRDAEAFGMWSKAPHRSSLSEPQQVRLWQLEHWHDQPLPGAHRRRADSELLMTAYSRGAATLADIADHLLGPRGASRYSDESFDLLAEVTGRKREPLTVAWLAAYPEVQALTDRAVERILELELARGDAPTAATAAALALTTLWGIDTLQRVLQALGKGEFKLATSWRGNDALERRPSLTHLAKIVFPRPDESSEMFARAMKSAVAARQFPHERVVQLTFLAPQWSKHVEAYLGWEQMSEGVYWFLAHMNYVWGLTENAAVSAGMEEEPAPSNPPAQRKPEDDPDRLTEAVTVRCDVDAETMQPPRTLSLWERLILERTPLSADDRNEGAIDVAWFRRTYEQLGAKRWQELAAAARFAANPSQARRAQFIADVLLDRVKRKELVDGIKQKQLKEHVRLLGLLPLAKGAKAKADLHERCKILRDYRRYANGLSGLTKPAALLSWNIGMKNLAQTAGYADPLRLEWAVGAESVADLAKGPTSVKKGDVTVTLALDEMARPELTVQKNGKPLKSIPPAIKKDKKIAELAARVTDLKRQAASIRQSLEAAMCRGDVFTCDELRCWCAHAQLAPLLTRLVVVGEGVLGYPDKQGKALRDYRGKLEPVKPSERLRLAHPYDLFATGDWQHWQRECFQAERVQPFKQIFRELYLLTKQEKKDGSISHRYDGQQIQPTQGLALFGNRGWNTQDGIFKVFHDEGLTATVYFQSGVTTPLEVEGATLAGITFTPRDNWKPLKLSAVPPRLFSEVMRDIDLVVSVAHAGGVDPEASASTVEMRAGLLRETCQLLKLKNVRFKPSHALIDGKLSNYSVHLGSGVVHAMPGGALCIVPVHAQQRGRLFLPFADDDPRTAEVISKVLLLARDQEIQDPAILEQIRR